MAKPRLEHYTTYWFDLIRAVGRDGKVIRVTLKDHKTATYFRQRFNALKPLLRDDPRHLEMLGMADSIMAQLRDCTVIFLNREQSPEAQALREALGDLAGDGEAIEATPEEELGGESSATRFAAQAEEPSNGDE